MLCVFVRLIDGGEILYNIAHLSSEGMVYIMWLVIYRYCATFTNAGTSSVYSDTAVAVV